MLYAYVQVPWLFPAVRSVARRSRMYIRWRLLQTVYDPHMVTPELVEEVYQGLRVHPAGQAFISWLRSELGLRGMRTGYVDQLPEVATPTLIMHGKNDWLVPVECAEQAHLLLPDSRLRIFERCGHWVPREKPDEFVQEVLDFLGDRAPSVSVYDTPTVGTGGSS